MARKRTRARRVRGEGAFFWSEAKQLWVARKKVGGKRQEFTGRTHQEIHDKIAKAEERASQGMPPEANCCSSTYVCCWLDNVAKPKIEPTTWATYERAYRLHLAPHLANVPLSSLTPARLEALLGDLHVAGVTGGLAQKVFQVLGSALRHAEKNGLLKLAPDHIPSPRAADTLIEPFVRDEVRAILAAAASLLPDVTTASQARYRALWPLAFGTGMRRGEILALDWTAVDLSRGNVRVERSLCCVNGELRLKAPKTKRGRRSIDLPAFAVVALRGHQERMQGERHGSTAVFCTRTGSMIHGSTVTQKWHDLLQSAGVRPRNFHQIRHTHASQLLADGVPLLEVARRLGDKPETILRVYAHWMPADISVPNRLDHLYDQGEP